MLKTNLFKLAKALSGLVNHQALAPSRPEAINSDITKIKIPTSFTAGAEIGVYNGQTIFDCLTDNHGVVRHFVGLVPKNLLLMDCPNGAIIAGAPPCLLYLPTASPSAP